jgi:hypothetical protein
VSSLIKESKWRLIVAIKLKKIKCTFLLISFSHLPIIVNTAITFIVNKVIKDNLNSLLNAFYVYTFISSKSEEVQKSFCFDIKKVSEREEEKEGRFHQ